MYVYDHVEPVENGKVHLEISEVTENNVINVYYVRNSFEYKVEYYKDSVSGEKLGETETKTQKVGTTMAETLVTEDFGAGWLNEHKPTTGYKDGEVEYYITIQANNENVIKVVYKPVTDIPYTIEYYYNGVKNEDNTVPGKGSFGERITAENKDNNGEWELEENATLTFTIASVTENVFRVYYVKPDIEVVKTSTPSVKRAKSIVEPGETITYTITATNKGKKDGTVKISDTIPTGTTLEGTITATGFDSVSVEELATGITLTVPASETAKVEFTVKVIGENLEKIVNRAKVNDEETPGTTVENEVEKTVNLKAKSETKTIIKGSNIVIVLDYSNSMKKKVNGNKIRMEIAKDVTKKFIDMVDLPETATDKSSTIKVIKFGTSALEVGGATTSGDVEGLKDEISKIKPNSGSTVMDKALIKAEKALRSLHEIKPENKNVVIFVSDGEPTYDGGGKLIDYTNIKKAADSLKKVEPQTTIYAVAFEADIVVLRDKIATPGKYYTTNQVPSLSGIFTEIATEIGGEEVPTQSVGGKIELDDINISREVKVNGIALTEEEKNNNKIVLINGKYYLDLSKFDTTQNISVEYFTKN